MGEGGEEGGEGRERGEEGGIERILKYYHYITHLCNS